jgi:Excalibur calcium-binding domain
MKRISLFVLLATVLLACAPEYTTTTIDTTNFNIEPGNSRHEFGGNPGHVFDYSGSDIDCEDFASQPQSQMFFDTNGGGPGDRHALDADNDGIPCEDTENWTVDARTTSVVTSSPSGGSPGRCWINGYTRKNGTYVNGYWRRC